MRKANEYSLVLRAMEIPHAIRQEGPATFALVVFEHDVARAMEELTRYERENSGWPPRHVDLSRNADWISATVVYCLVLGLLHVCATQGWFGLDWYRLGAASSQPMRAGEWWRAVTALSLHSGLGHLLGNLLFGGFFGAILAQSVGVGIAWASIVLAGSLGFALEAVLRQQFITIGASTAVFAALGIQVAYQWRLRSLFKGIGWKRWAPVFAGVILLGYLGINDPREAPVWAAREAARIDVVGHACGFVCGLAVGWWLAWGPRGIVAGPRVQALFAVLAPLALAAAWFCAIRFGA
jgi:membrane associated rhomboid family serine protease